MTRSRRASQTLLAVFATTLASVIAAPVALGAGTAVVNGGQVDFTAADGFENSLTVTTSSASPPSVTIADTADDITAGSGCLPGDTPSKVVCSGETVNFFDLNLGDLADSAIVSGPLEGTLRGGPGVDSLTGGAGNERLAGGEGADVLAGSAGDDVLTDFDFVLTSPPAPPSMDAGDRFDGGPGNDLLAYLPQDGEGDVLLGGPGVDTVGVDPLFIAFVAFLSGGAGGSNNDALGVVVDLDAGTLRDKDAMRGTTGEQNTIGSVENLEGFGNDTVLGSAAPNDYRQVSPFGGVDETDTVDLRSGPDVVSVGDGDDQVTSDDGFRDQVLCGDGSDTVAADRFDELTECENVTRSATPSADQETRDRFIVGIVNPDRTAPVCTLSGPKANLSSTAFLRTGGIAARLSCNEAITGRVRILTRVRSARGVTTAATGDLVLAERTVSGSGSRTVRLKPSRRLAKALGRRYKVRVVAEVRDAFGNRTSKAKRVTVRVPKPRRATRRSRR